MVYTSSAVCNGASKCFFNKYILYILILIIIINIIMSDYMRAFERVSKPYRYIWYISSHFWRPALLSLSVDVYTKQVYIWVYFKDVYHFLQNPHFLPFKEPLLLLMETLIVCKDLKRTTSYNI